MRAASVSAIVLVALGLAAGPGLGADGGPVVVLRGAGPPGEPGPVVVLRGAGPGAPATAEPAPAAGPIVVGGERLWVLDRAAGRLVACRLIGTSTVGRRAIECTARPLS